MRRSDCLIIIPAYNEEQNIGKVLQEIGSLHVDLDIVVVNDGSRDKTGEIVQKEGEQVINLPYNLGYGGALQTGFKYAAAMGYSYVIQIDADGQHDPGEIQIMLNQLRTGDVDILIGSRFLGRGSFRTGLLKKVAISVFRFLIKISTGVKVTDPTSGLQGLTNRVFKYYATMGNFPSDFPDADTIIFMLLSNYRVKEFPANIRERNFGKSMHSGIKTIFYFAKMLVSILVVILRKKAKVEVNG